MYKVKLESILKLTFFMSILISYFSYAQVINDPLQGSTVGTQIGGSFTSEGYKPGTGYNHILYTVPSKVSNGYIEFEMKGFTVSGLIGESNDHGFLSMFDGRGVGNNPTWNDFRDNYFRWNFHWRQNAGVFKCVVNCAAPGKPLHNNKAVFWDVDGDGSSIDDRDWYDEPSGSSFSWDSGKSTWYKIKIEWKDKTFKVYIDGQKIWENHKTGEYDYAPEDHKIWLGSGISKYDSDNPDVVYRNFKLYDHGGGTSNYLNVSPSSREVSSASGSTEFSVSSNVSWNASDDAGWLSVSPSSGNDDGTLDVNYDENTSSDSRTGTITVSGGGISRNVTVVQEGQVTSNYLTVTPSNRNVSSSSGSTTFEVDSDISWNVSDDSDWLSVSPVSGSGDGTISADYDENTTTSSRTATITIEGGGISREVTVNQSGQTVDPFLNVSPSNYDVSVSSGSVEFTIESNVDWQIRDDAKWLAKTPKNGSGNGTFDANYESNPTADIRVATITIEGAGISRTVTVSQAAASAYLSVSPSSLTVGDTSGSASFTISSNDDWSISVDSDWLSLSASSGNGDSVVTANFQENSDSLKRTATISVSGAGTTKTLTLTQTGAPTVTITAEVTPASSGNISGTGSYIENTEVSVICTPNSGWKFERWIEDGNTVSTDSMFIFTANSSRHLEAELSEIVTDISQGWGESKPLHFELLNNYPNPFNPSTTIRYAIPEQSWVKISVYNLLGQKIADLVNGEKEVGFYSVIFEASNIPSGTYLYKIDAGNYSETKKLIILK